MSKPRTTADALIGSVLSVTKKWTKQRKAEERERRAIQNRRARMTCVRVTAKDVAYRCMEHAYKKASANGTLPASARQIMYQARPIIQAETGEQLDDQYFCQQLLPNYMQERNVTWNVVYDDRGHLREPHTSKSLGLGTLAVQRYLADIREPKTSEIAIEPPEVITSGPEGRYGAVLFIEKEGFMPLFESVDLAERYDIAIMSTKGQSVTASRLLIDKLCGQHGLPLLVLHDFDKAGFSILGKLGHSNRRYQYRHRVNVIDFGLRLKDVQDLELEEFAEDTFDNGSELQRRINMRENGATEDEIAFMLHQRVELNAITSDQLVEWIEDKLVENNIKKVVPAEQALAKLYRRLVEHKIVEEYLADAKERARMTADAAVVPGNLHEQVQRYLQDNPQAAWDDALAEIMSVNAGGTA
jgi:hypothetical protein